MPISFAFLAAKIRLSTRSPQIKCIHVCMQQNYGKPSSAIFYSPLAVSLAHIPLFPPQKQEQKKSLYSIVDTRIFPAQKILLPSPCLIYIIYTVWNLMNIQKYEKNYSETMEISKIQHTQPRKQANRTDLFIYSLKN